MNEQQKQNLKLWAEALRSGKYQQAQNSLKTDDGYCCWGVACEISGLGTWSRCGYVNYFTVNGGSCELHANSGNPPPEISYGWAGLNRARDLILDREGFEHGLIELNDSGEFNFSQIADIIEALANGWDISGQTYFTR